MPGILDVTGPIDPAHADYVPLLRQTQGNILKGHGRDFAKLIFFRFNPPAEEARPLLIDLLRGVTSAYDQLQQTADFKNFGTPGPLFMNFFLSAKGYAALGFDQKTFVNHFVWNMTSSFFRGMKRNPRLKDPAFASWERPYQDDIHAMLLLADDNPSFLARRTGEVMHVIRQFATIVTVEHGAALRDETGEGLEHFGFKDGLSGPVFFRTDLKRPVGEPRAWNDAASLRLALLRDPMVNDEAACGSFLVFRKLEQDVRGFIDREREIADEMLIDRGLVGAMVIGRFRDGSALLAGSTNDPRDANDFNYAKDDSGAKCPFHAHIRKTNPRGEAPGIMTDVRIVRRGIPYGNTPGFRPAASLPENLRPAGGVGLLFMCFQSDPEGQFNKLQADWANSTAFRQSDAGLDALIGQGSGVDQRWPYGRDTANPHMASFSGFVKMKGGEYFFAPSLPFLRKLAP
ncbi:MAG TPA: Dyp-type peroxidase [Thermoanaerobaculia bacterium]|nr:Dyp-type peroxidase [Thermoanaerobaculia bacterium]